MSGKEDEYKTVSIPIELDEEIVKLIGTKGFRSKAEIVKEALRKLIKEYSDLPILEHFNLDERGVKILDREVNQVIDVFFSPKGIRCDYCEAWDCRHIQFALKVPAIKDIVRKKRRQGWDLPEI